MKTLNLIEPDMDALHRGISFALRTAKKAKDPTVYDRAYTIRLERLEYLIRQTILEDQLDPIKNREGRL